jgi:capsular polysaccharide biosynthesis protein
MTLYSLFLFSLRSISTWKDVFFEEFRLEESNIVNGTMKTVKQLYQRIFSYHLRGQIKLIVFKLFRKLQILSLLNKIGFLAANRYLPLNGNNIEEVLGVSNGHTQTYKIVEDIITTEPANHLSEQVLNEIQPFAAVTETVVLDTRDCGFSFRNNYILDRKLNVIGGYRIEFEKLPIYIQTLSNATRLSGTVAYLSESEPSNYYHWMCATLPLIRFYQKFYNLADIDFFYVGQFPLSGFHEETLRKAGISMRQVIQKACTADRLVAAISSRFMGVNDPVSEEAYRFTRSLFQNECHRGAEKEKIRIYVPRGNVSRRRVINETAVIDLLSAYGFQTVEMDGKTVKEQAEIFSRAEAIVAPHGAALTNLLFAQPLTTVIEIIPNGFTNNCFYVLANYGKLNYLYLQGENIGQTKDAHHRDIYVDIQKLEKICQMSLRKLNYC